MSASYGPAIPEHEPAVLREYEAAKVNTIMPKVNPPPAMNHILEHIGNTPLVKLNRVGSDLKCNIWAKCEFFNAGGSVKDRIGYRMVMEAEQSGRIKEGDTIIEPTSGNTGIGLALACAVRGYRCIIVLPEKMSQEKIAVLKALGAEIVRTPTEAAWDAPESHINTAAKLQQEIPNAHILDQYINPNNPDAHFYGTGPEVIEQITNYGGKVDMLCVGAGTGGTITGMAKALRKHNPDVEIIGVDPLGSILAQPVALNETDVTGYQVEGTGYDFVPKVLNRTIIDRWIKTHDHETFNMGRRLIREEGLLCGGSSGGTVWAALQAAKDLKEGQNVVVVLADSVRNYMTKYLSDDWMYDHRFFDESRLARDESELAKWKGATVKDLKLQAVVKIAPDMQCSQAATLMKNNNFDQLPVCDSHGKLLGLVTLGNLLSRMMAGKTAKADEVSSVMFKFNKRREFAPYSDETLLAHLSKFFEIHSIAFISAADGSLQHVVTKVDILHWLVENSTQ